MPGKCKFLSVLAVFLVALAANPPAARAQTDDCYCNGPNGTCAPGGNGIPGAFQNGLIKGLQAAGQDQSTSYNYGAWQVARVDLNGYGLGSINGIFAEAIGDVYTIISTAGAGSPDEFVVDQIVNQLATQILTAVYNKYLAPNLTAAFGFANALACMPMPSFNLTVTTIQGVPFAKNCGNVGGINMPQNPQQQQTHTIYGLFWNQ
jgi:hypothetical protein